MRLISIWPAVLGLAMAMVLVLVLQVADVVEPVRHSLSYASGSVVLLALIGWALEARRVAGPAPAVELEHEEEEVAPGPSYWPAVLALGVVGIAAGLVYGAYYGAFVVAIPMALAAAGFWANDIKEELSAGPAALPFYVPPARPEQAPAGAGGTFLMPLAPRALAAQAAGGAAIAIETFPARQVSRRGLLRIVFWSGLGAGLAALAGSMVDMLYPRNVKGFGGLVAAGTVDQYPAGSMTQNLTGKFWLVNLTAEQGGPGFLALWQKCPHLGCTVPWRPEFSFVDPNSGQESKGWFRCPCHGSTYTHAGVRVFGPAPRSLDRMAITIDPGSKAITVNTGKISKGVPENAAFAVKAP